MGCAKWTAMISLSWFRSCPAAFRSDKPKLHHLSLCEGKGVSFMENTVCGTTDSDRAELERALADLEKGP